MQLTNNILHIMYSIKPTEFIIKEMLTNNNY